MITLKFTNLPLLFLLIAHHILCDVGGRYLLILTFFTCFESIQSDCPLYHWTIINLPWPWWSYCLTKTYSSSKHILKKVGNLYEETISFVLYFIQKAIAILSWVFEYLALSLLLQWRTCDLWVQLCNKSAFIMKFSHLCNNMITGDTW